MSSTSTGCRDPSRVVPNVEALIRKRIADVDKIPKHGLADPELVEGAREAVCGLLGGDVKVTEDADGVYAVVELGRVYIQSGAGRGT